MQIIRALVVAAVVPWSLSLLACGSSITTSGINAKEFFVLTEGWVWQYTCPDSADADKLYEVWSLGEENIEGHKLSVLSWKFATPQELALDENEAQPQLFFMDTYWSKSDDGVLFWGARAADGSSGLTPWVDGVYDAGVVFAGVDLYPDEEVASSSNGDEWTSLYVDPIDIDTDGGNFTGALQFSFTDAAGSHPFAGDWYLARQNGIVQFTVGANGGEVWSLKTLDH